MNSYLTPILLSHSSGIVHRLANVYWSGTRNKKKKKKKKQAIEEEEEEELIDWLIDCFKSS